ncbi:MAG: hypothetical protein ABWY25_05745 [Paenisporosarcina sp.]
MAKKKEWAKKYRWTSVKHKQVYLKTRGHWIDIHVYPIMQQLWDAGIQTFFSCQGGPDKLLYASKTTSDRAYVVILKKDRDKALKILSHLNPKVGSWKNRYRRDQIGIKFDPSEEAQAVIVKVLAE